MERLSDNAIEIINALHTEKLDYRSEYLPLIEAANLLATYEDTGLTPDEIVAMSGEMVTAYDSDYKPYLLEATGSEAKHIIDLLNAERDGRLVVLPCKEGTKVYKISHRLSGDHEIVKTWFNLTYIKPNDFGKTVFLTREEAEAALEVGGTE